MWGETCARVDCSVVREDNTWQEHVPLDLLVHCLDSSETLDQRLIHALPFAIPSGWYGVLRVLLILQIRHMFWKIADSKGVP